MINSGYGFVRSWLIYRARFWRQSRTRKFYSRFVRPGSLCFDIGSHVGNRVSAWRALGARVVAIEPQPIFAKYLRHWVADSKVEVIECALAEKPGTAELFSSSRNPTVSTISTIWRDHVASDPGFRGVNWDCTNSVEVRTLDQLITSYGIPDFCKIDVEGAELSVLRGTQSPLPALSFEAISAVREDAIAVVDLLETRASYRFNWSPSETMSFAWTESVGATGIRDYLGSFKDGSGDVYAWLES